MDSYEENSESGSSGLKPRTDARSEDDPENWTSEWFPRLYRELRALAHSQRGRYRDRNAPGTTSIVHEAYERLHHAPAREPENPLHFYRTAARAMRSVIVDNARRHRAVRHGGHLERAPAESLELVSIQRGDELLALDEALHHLAEADPDLAELVDLRIYGGLTVEELAELLDVSTPTIKRRWKLACTWLYDHLARASV